MIYIIIVKVFLTEFTVAWNMLAADARTFLIYSAHTVHPKILTWVVHHKLPHFTCHMYSCFLMCHDPGQVIIFVQIFRFVDLQAKIGAAPGALMAHGRLFLFFLHNGRIDYNNKNKNASKAIEARPIPIMCEQQG